MSVPSTLQKTHDGCGGTVVFRPATKRRALLAGDQVTLQAACRSCGETLRITWALPGCEEWASTSEPTPVTLDTERDHATAAAPARERVAAPSDQPSDLETRRSARVQRTAARREAREQELELPLAAGAETQWFDPEQYPALARAHRSAIETFDTIEAELRAEDEASVDGALAWRSGAYGDMLAVEGDVELDSDIASAPVFDAAAALEAATTKPSRIARGFAATPKTASTAANAEIDAFLGKFADRVARARKKLTDVQTNLPNAVAESKLRAPELRRAVEEQDIATAAPKAEESSAPIARPTFVAEISRTDVNTDAPITAPIAAVERTVSDPVYVVAPPIDEPQAAVEPEFTFPEAVIEPEPVMAPAPAPALELEPAHTSVVVELPTMPAPTFAVAASAPTHAPAFEPAPMAVAVLPPAPAAVPAAVVVVPETSALPRVELAPPAPLPVVLQYPTPLHERAQLESTDADVFGARPVVAPELVSEVWGDGAADEYAGSAYATDGFQPAPPAPVFTYDDEPADEHAGSFGALGADHGDGGFDWSDDGNAGAGVAPKQPREPKRKPARDKSRAKSRARRERKPTASRTPAQGGSAARAAAIDAPRVHVRMGLPEVAIVVILAAVAGIAFMKLVNTPPQLSAKVDGHSISSSSHKATASAGDLVAGGGDTATPAASAPALQPESSDTTNTTQDPATAADTPATAASPGSSPQSTPSADA